MRGRQVPSKRIFLRFVHIYPPRGGGGRTKRRDLPNFYYLFVLYAIFYFFYPQGRGHRTLPLGTRLRRRLFSQVSSGLSVCFYGNLFMFRNFSRILLFQNVFKQIYLSYFLLPSFNFFSFYETLGICKPLPVLIFLFSIRF